MSNLYRLETVNDIAIELIARDYENGYLSYEGMPLPILYDEADEVTYAICDYMQSVFKIEYEKGQITQKQRDFLVLYYSMLWSALAGIGAAELWEKMGKKLIKEGVVSSLIKETGFFSMDEYVLNMVIRGAGAEEKDNLRNRIDNHIRPEVEHVIKDIDEKAEKSSSLVQDFKNLCKGFYIYGLVIQEEIISDE